MHKLIQVKLSVLVSIKNVEEYDDIGKACVCDKKLNSEG